MIFPILKKLEFFLAGLFCVAFAVLCVFVLVDDCLRYSRGDSLSLFVGMILFYLILGSLSVFGAYWCLWAFKEYDLKEEMKKSREEKEKRKKVKMAESHIPFSKKLQKMSFEGLSHFFEVTSAISLFLIFPVIPLGLYFLLHYASIEKYSSFFKQITEICPAGIPTKWVLLICIYIVALWYIRMKRDAKFNFWNSWYDGLKLDKKYITNSLEFSLAWCMVFCFIPLIPLYLLFQEIMYIFAQQIGNASNNAFIEPLIRLAVSFSPIPLTYLYCFHFSMHCPSAFTENSKRLEYEIERVKYDLEREKEISGLYRSYLENHDKEFRTYLENRYWNHLNGCDDYGFRYVILAPHVEKIQMKNEKNEFVDFAKKFFNFDDVNFIKSSIPKFFITMEKTFRNYEKSNEYKSSCCDYKSLGYSRYNDGLIVTENFCQYPIPLIRSDKKFGDSSEWKFKEMDCILGGVFSDNRLWACYSRNGLHCNFYDDLGDFHVLTFNDCNNGKIVGEYMFIILDKPVKTAFSNIAYLLCKEECGKIIVYRFSCDIDDVYYKLFHQKIAPGPYGEKIKKEENEVWETYKENSVWNGDFLEKEKWESL